MNPTPPNCALPQLTSVLSQLPDSIINTSKPTDICMFQPFAGAHLGIKSWLRAASLVKVAMRTLMARGAQLGVLACGRSWVISKSTASRVSKNRVICSTVQRLS